MKHCVSMHLKLILINFSPNSLHWFLIQYKHNRKTNFYFIFMGFYGRIVYSRRFTVQECSPFADFGAQRPHSFNAYNNKTIIIDFALVL